jgi:aldose 1-epimerase
MEPTTEHALGSGVAPAGPGEFVLEAGDSRLTVCLEAGGRIGSLIAGGRELLATTGRDSIHWGSFPMVPFAGRVRDGSFSFGGSQYRLSTAMPPHAIHGTVFDRPWDLVDACTIATDLGDDWPWDGQVVQRFALEPDRLTLTTELRALEPMPGAIGWHPWFRRRLDGSGPLVLHLDAATMLRRDPDGVASRERVLPSAGPWDDCFTELRRPIVIEWPGVLALEVTSSCPWWVVYDEEPEAVCVEPQTEPPDELNHEPRVLAPGTPLVATMTWRWWAPAGPTTTG